MCVCVCVCAKREIKTNNAKKQNLFKMKKTISLINSQNEPRHAGHC